MKSKYGEKDGIKAYNQENGVWDRIGLGLTLLKVEFWSYKYDFSFQMWGLDQNNCWIYKGTIKLAEKGGFATAKEMFEWIVDWCRRANPRVKYPDTICGKDIELPD